MLKDIPYLGYFITREGIKTDPKKVQGFMDIGRPSTTTEARAIIYMVQYYMDMWPRQSHILDSLTDAASVLKYGNILWDDALESSFKKLKRMVSAEKLLIYPYWKLPFTVHTDAYDKHLGAVISKNNTPIDFFTKRLIKPHCNYTTTKKKLLEIVELLKQFQGIVFDYEINIL